ncbi:MAG: molybdopterin-binding protein [Sedimentibacter sp.]|jgi:molybdopterin biosynthesis enzyme|nr:molybdopterin-binding protein [Sedimentibacter sp.]
MLSNVVIIPTGDELNEGIVLDTDSPMIMQEIIKLDGRCNILRSQPVYDKEDKIIECIKSYAAGKADLIIIIGGSGGGHRYSRTLGKDYTHSALDLILEEKHSSEVYGKNGHMWSKLTCGRLNETLIINVPGPYDEARAVIKAFCSAYKNNKDNLKELNRTMMKALIGQYGNQEPDRIIQED